MEKFLIFISVILTSLVKILSQEDLPEIQLDWLEKDKILTCAEFINRKFQLDNKIIEEMSIAFGPNKERAISKITGDMYSLCYNKIDDETVRNTFSNLTFYEFEWNDEFSKFVKVDYSKYRNIQDIEMTPEQQLLFYKLDKVRNEFIVTNRERKEKASKSLPPIFGFDFMAVSPQVKLIYTIAVFVIFALGILIALRKLMKSKNEKKKKKSK